MSTPKAIIISSIIIGVCLILATNNLRYEVISLGSHSVIKFDRASGDFWMCSPKARSLDNLALYTYECGYHLPTIINE